MKLKLEQNHSFASKYILQGFSLVEFGYIQGSAAITCAKHINAMHTIKSYIKCVQEFSILHTKIYCY